MTFTAAASGNIRESIASDHDSDGEPEIVHARTGTGTTSGTFGATSTAVTVGKKRKAMDVRSDVWQHFIKVKDKEGALKAKCNYCHKLLACTSKISGTSSLRSHSNTCKKRPGNISSQTELVASGYGSGSSLGVWRFDEVEARRALAFMIIVDELPFSFLDKEGFRYFLSIVCPRFHIPSRQTIARDIFQRFNDEKLMLKDFLRIEEQRVCLTTDTWTSVQNMSYMSLTAHYIDRKWKYHKKILNFCTITSHKGDDIGKAIETCLLEWGIDKVFTVTVDNASANDTVVDYLKRKMKNWGASVVDGKYMHMRCMAHIINLVVVDGLREPEPKAAVEKIRCAVKYIKKSPSRVARFKECAERAKIESKSLLCLDVCTRWNSTFLMLDAAQKFEKAFEIYAEDDPRFESELIVVAGGMPDENDWAVARSLNVALKNFYDLTKRISGSLYVTSNNFFEEITLVAQWLDIWCRSDDTLFVSMAKKMKLKYEKYWGDLGRTNMLIYIASILDPRNKLIYVELIVNDLYRSDKEYGVQLCERIKECLYELFAWYENKLKPNKHSSVAADSIVSSPAENASDTTSEPESLRDQIIRERKKMFEIVQRKGSGSSTSDLSRYLNEQCESMDSKEAVIDWWKRNSPHFPILSEMARDILAIPVSTVASESAFSTGGRILDDFRSSLSPKMVQSLICSQNWLRKQQCAVEDEENEEVVTELDKELAKYSIPSTILGI